MISLVANQKPNQAAKLGLVLGAAVALFAPSSSSSMGSVEAVKLTWGRSWNNWWYKKERKACLDMLPLEEVQGRSHIESGTMHILDDGDLFWGLLDHVYVSELGVAYRNQIYGKGTLCQLRAKTIYVGTRCHMQGQSEGTIYYKDHDEYKKYVGTWNDSGIRWGEGTMIYKNNDKYEGAWVVGERYGKGTLKYKKDGENFEYDGEWKRNKRHGEGKLKRHGHDGETILVGTWVDGDLKMVSSSQEKDSCEKMLMSTGRTSLNMKIKKEEAYRFQNGNLYWGELRLLNGKQTFYDKDGVLCRPQKWVYTGELITFKSGKRFGKGTLYRYEDQKTYAGSWQHNKLVLGRSQDDASVTKLSKQEAKEWALVDCSHMLHKAKQESWVSDKSIKYILNDGDLWWPQGKRNLKEGQPHGEGVRCHPGKWVRKGEWYHGKMHEVGRVVVYDEAAKEMRSFAAKWLLGKITHKVFPRDTKDRANAEEALQTFKKLQ